MTIFFLKSENFRSPKNSNNSNKSKIINNEISLVQWKQNKFKFKFRLLFDFSNLFSKIYDKFCVARLSNHT